VSKAAASVTLVTCGGALGSGAISYGGVIGISGIGFNVSKYGRYYVTIHLAGTISYAVFANLTGPNNATSPASASAGILVGMKIHDATNSSWDFSGGSWNEHAKSCGTRYGWYCPLVRASVTNGSVNHTSPALSVSENLTWRSGPYKWLNPGDTYELGASVEFGVYVTSSTVAAGSMLSASLAFDLRYTTVTVQGPF
jgi:hypothetical protein